MKTSIDDSRSCSSSTGDVFIDDCIYKNTNEFMYTNTIFTECGRRNLFNFLEFSIFAVNFGKVKPPDFN